MYFIPSAVVNEAQYNQNDFKQSISPCHKLIKFLQLILQWTHQCSHQSRCAYCMSESFVKGEGKTLTHVSMQRSSLHQMSVTLSYNLQQLESAFVIAMHMAQHVGNAGDRKLGEKKKH